MDKVMGMLKAIYLVVLSIALVVFGYLISGGTYNTISVIMFVIGGILCFAGVIVEVFAMTSDKED